MTAFPLIYEEFNKLINFFSLKLGYEDAASELTLFLIEMLYDIRLEKFQSDGSEDIQKYIAASIKNKYIALSKGKAKNMLFENELFEDCCSYFEDFDGGFYCIQGVSRLTAVQRKIVLYHYIYGYSIAEIAERFGVTRQAVNKTKNHALEILKKELLADEGMLI